MNYNMIRYSDILLMAAECEVEVGTQAQAEVYVNMVRGRMVDNPTNWVYGRLTGYGLTGGVADASKPIEDNTQYAANYVISRYSGQIATGTKEFARQAVFYERRIELAMEGQRFFDLQRWDGGSGSGAPEPAGYMATLLNAYIKLNTSYPQAFFANTVLQGATFTQGKNEIYPIPTEQISIEKGALKQNAGYP
jgi:hypothetical protein